MKRIFTAAVGVPILVALLFWGPPLLVRLALTLVSVLTLHEFLQLSRQYGVQPMDTAAYVAAGWIMAFSAATDVAQLVAFAMLLLVLGMWPGRELAGLLPAAAATLLGIVYTAAPFRLAAELHAASPHWLVYVLLVNWIGDAAAYYTGRAVGKRKLAPRISPAKTWEGAAASFAVGVIAGVLYLRYFLAQAGAVAWAVGLSAAVNLAGQVGDLAESALKRGAGVKDSGGLLPGHGGMLDRLDGVLFSIPVVYLARTPETLWRGLSSFWAKSL